MNPTFPRRTAGALLLASALSLGAPLRAEAQVWIAGASGGLAKQNDYDIGVPIENADDSDAAFRIFGGYQVSSMQAVIASYVDLGAAQYSGPALGGFADSLEADGIDVSYVVGWAPGDQNRFSLFGTVGVLSWDQDVSLTDSTIDFEASDDGTSLSLGFGVEVNMKADGSSPWGVHFNYQLFKDVGTVESSGQELDREIAAVGVSYRFGGSR